MTEKVNKVKDGADHEVPPAKPSLRVTQGPFDSSLWDGECVLPL